MNSNTSGKRLLIMGGTTLMCHVVRVAKSMGLYVVVTDMDPDSPAKKIADKAYDISTSNFDEMEKMAISEKIDGVFVGYDDQNPTYAIELCNRIGVPFYATKEQIDITKHKNLFKHICQQHNVPVVPEYSLNDVKFPCVVKPVDSYSAKGISICHSEDDLHKAIDFAISFSKSKQFIIEEYFDHSDSECINIDYLIVDGEIILTAVGDKKVVKQDDFAPLTSAVIYPSIRDMEYRQKLNERVKSMFRNMGIMNGTLFIESFYRDGNFYFYEMGYRVGGGQSSIILNHLFNVDYIKMLINYAVTNRMTINDEKISEEMFTFNNVAGGITLLSHPGKIREIVGVDKLKEDQAVINVTQYLHAGDSIASKFKGTLGQTFARIHIICKDYDDLKHYIKKIYETIHIISSTGEDLLVRNSDLDKDF